LKNENNETTYIKFIKALLHSILGTDCNHVTDCSVVPIVPWYQLYLGTDLPWFRLSLVTDYNEVGQITFQKGATTFDASFDCQDDDTGDSITYDFRAINNSDRFHVLPSGLIEFNVDYDVDNAYPTEEVLTVYCIDSGHIDGNPLTGSAQVTITVTVSNLKDCFLFIIICMYSMFTGKELLHEG
jgi:hypothetical protein